LLPARAVRIIDPERSRSFYEALGFTFAGDFDIVRDAQLEATNDFFSLGDPESVLELMFGPEGSIKGSIPAARSTRSNSI
jgi:hypothetical protein